MNLELTETQKMIQDTARNFAKSELDPVAAKLDQQGDRGIETEMLVRPSRRGAVTEG